MFDNNQKKQSLLAMWQMPQTVKMNANRMNGNDNKKSRDKNAKDS